MSASILLRSRTYSAVSYSSAPNAPLTPVMPVGPCVVTGICGKVERGSMNVDVKPAADPEPEVVVVERRY